MSKGYKFANFDTFQSVENMNPIIRQQQYAYNGRMFIPPSNEKFTLDTLGKTQNNMEYQGLIQQLNNNESVRPYELYKNSNSQQDTNVDIISNIVVPNTLSRAFFSNDNVECIQRQIITDVYNQSQKQISKQSYQELQIIMKSIYLQYSRNLSYDIKEQIKTLNKYVIDECVSIIIPNVIQYNKYITEITGPLPIPPRSINVSSKGEKSLLGTASLI